MNKKSAHVMNWRNRVKQKLVEYKGGACEKCGYSKKIYNVYSFHHKDPNKKDFTIAGKSWGYERLKKEVDKCLLVCENCHREIHWEINQKKRQERLEITVNSIPKIQCKGCNKTFQPENRRNKYCGKKCYSKSMTHPDKPTKAKLKKMIETMSWTAIGKEYGVSDNAIRKWARGYELI